MQTHHRAEELSWRSIRVSPCQEGSCIWVEMILIDSDRAEGLCGCQVRALWRYGGKDAVGHGKAGPTDIVGATVSLHVIREH